MMRQRQRFAEKLQADMPFAGSQGFQYADFMRPLLDAEEHDVHDADAGHGQSEQADDVEQAFGGHAETVDNGETFAESVKEQTPFHLRG